MITVLRVEVYKMRHHSPVSGDGAFFVAEEILQNHDRKYKTKEKSVNFSCP